MRNLSHMLITISFLASLLACFDPVNPEFDMDLAEDASSDFDREEDASFVGKVNLRHCEHEPGTRVELGQPQEAWLQRSSAVKVKSGEANHALHDVLTTRDRAVDIVGYVTYGAFGSGLEGEFAELYIHNCEDGFELMSRRLIGSGGQVRFVIAEEDVPYYGVYSIAMRVPGDQSLVVGRLRVFPEGMKFVVVDLDGVLSEDSVSKFESQLQDLFEPIGLGQRVPQSRESAVEMIDARVEQGYEVLYLTSRSYALVGKSRAWLGTRGFAPGTLWFADQPVRNASDALAYKAGVLGRLAQRGYHAEVGYAATAYEVSAFEKAEVSSVFTVGESALDGGGEYLGPSYAAHVGGLDISLVVDQPFE